MSDKEDQRRRYWETVLPTVVAHAPIALYAVDRDGVFTFSDGKGLEAIGLRPGQVVGLSAYDVYRDVPEIVEYLRSALAGQHLVHVVHVGPLAFEARYAPTYDDGGRVSGVVGVAIDITDRERAEEAARLERHFSERLLESLPGLFYLYGEDLRLHRWNKNHETLTGYTGEELQVMGGLDWFDDPEERARVAVTAQRLLEEGGQTSEIARLTHKDGRRVPYLFRSVRFDSADGPMLMGVAFDVSDRLAAEEELRRSEQRFRRIVEASPMGMHLYELQEPDRLVFIGANPAAEAILGVSQEAFVGRTIEEAFPPLASTEVPDRYREVVRAGTVWRTTQIQYDDHVIRGAFDVVAFPIGERRMVAMFLDVSERVLAEQARLDLERRLQHAQKLESLGVLAGGLAHDFNNLLMAVLGNLDLAQQSLPPESPAREGLAQALQATRKANDLTRQMLAYSGRGRFLITQMDLAQIVRENADLLRAAISHTATLTLELGAEPARIEGDGAQIQQVVMNLITNASDALVGHAGVVALRTGVTDCDDEDLSRSRLDERQPAGRFAYLEVVDTGCGMDDATQQRLFDPFFTTKFTGRGLGMSAVLGIVRGHHGAILVDSAPGRGTTIRVMFPWCPAGPASEADPSGPSSTPGVAPKRRAVVLVVDDDEPVRSLCLAYVGRMGYDGIGAEDGEVAIEVFKQRPDIDCVLLDLTMPRMDGVATFRELQRIRPGVKVVLSSGFNEQDAVERLVGENLAGFVQKPFRLADLRERLSAVIGESAG